SRSASEARSRGSPGIVPAVGDRDGGALASKPKSFWMIGLLGLFLFPRGEDPWSLGGNGHRVLEVRGAGPVRGDDRPAIVKLDDVPLATGDHRLDRQRHPGAQPRPLPWRSVVSDDRVHMHLGTNAVPGVFTDQPVI